SHATLRGWVSGGSSSRPPDVTTTTKSGRARMPTLVPGTRSLGRSGAMISNTSAMPRRAQAKRRSRRLTSNAVTGRRPAVGSPKRILDQRHHAEDRQVHRHDQAADDHAEEHD